jgi:hypothetical protein
MPPSDCWQVAAAKPIFHSLATLGIAEKMLNRSLQITDNAVITHKSFGNFLANS